MAVALREVGEHAARIEIGNVLEEGEIKGAQVSLSFAVVQEAQGLNQPTS